MTTPRAIRQAFLAIEQSEGAGARVRRSIGTSKLRNFSPFLMLDHFTIHPGAGFPDHPHRGQETITYLLKGAVDHEDFAGNAGTIEAGDLQFMTAGKGIMHAEMPRQNPDGSANVGMQLWVDLPEKLKKCEPRYRDLRATEIPSIEVDEGKVGIKIISGRSHGTDSVQELAYTPVWIFDVTIRPGGSVSQELPMGWNAFAYTLDGDLTFGVGEDRTTVGKYHNVVFEQKGDVVVAEVDENAKQEGRFFLVAGLPLDQKVVQYGPFVLNSQEDVYQAMLDFQSHSNGDPQAIKNAYTPDSIWRNRDIFLRGHEEIVSMLTRKWLKERQYRLRKELFAFTDDKIAVQFWYEYKHWQTGKWRRCYGLEDWTFAKDGRMRKRQMSGNDLPITEDERWFKDGVDIDKVEIGEEHW
ncbi:hypothetical protein MMC20_005693 [Loxospora ochrophaea]|nr:hypothetical protein [Loxospora ochrophaea]